MPSPPEHAQPPEGLRERKKARTRAAIQRHALRLFAEHGYAETTVDEIAAAAEVSPSTFFRYFGTKEAVALYDAIDPIAFEALRAQPAELSPIQAFRAAFRALNQQLPPADLVQERQRAQLMYQVPELRAAAAEQLAGTIRMLSEQIAKRAGRDPGDLAVRAVAGAVTGISLAAMTMTEDDPSRDMFALIDEGLALLEAGLPL